MPMSFSRTTRSVSNDTSGYALWRHTFVVVWRRHGRWLQLMDLAIGRRWTTCQRFSDEMFRHELQVPAMASREWAASGAFLDPLRRRLSALGASVDSAACLIEKTLASTAALSGSVAWKKSTISIPWGKRGRSLFGHRSRGAASNLSR